MKVVKLTFRGGGITDFDKKGRFYSYLKGEKLYNEWKKAEISGNFTILRPEALKGVLCFLMGEIEKTSSINDNKLDAVIDKRKTKKIGQPWFEFIAVRYKKANALSSSVPMTGLTLDDAKDSMRLSKDVIAKVFGTNDLEQIYKMVNKPERVPLTQSHIDSAKLLIVRITQFPDAGKFWQTKIIRLKSFIKWAENELQTNPEPILVHKTEEGAGFFTDLTLKCYEGIVTKAVHDIDYRKQMNSSSLTFLPSTPQSKDYTSIKPDYVTSGVGYLLKSDFDVYLELDQEQFERLKTGPGSAFWAHGGIVRWEEVYKDEIPVDSETDVSYALPKKKAKGKK